MNTAESKPDRPRAGTVWVIGGVVALALVLIVAVWARKKVTVAPATRPTVDAVASPILNGTTPDPQSNTRLFSIVPLEQANLTFWWGELPEPVRTTNITAGTVSTIRRRDYVGAETCKECHPANYLRWSEHPHRWMNAPATTDTVRGDFSGAAEIHYLGGRGSFYRHNGGWRMHLERDGVTRIFDITRTLGSRFFQYYIGVIADGPEPPDHPARRVDHVLPFGYWLEPKEWVPVVHVGPELPDGERHDPFAAAPTAIYDVNCSGCHTTRPTGDWMLQMLGMERIEKYVPRPLAFHASEYIRDAHAETPNAALHAHPNRSEDFVRLFSAVEHLPARDYAATLGISCEACHNGARQHAENSTERETQQPPFFFPASPNLYVEATDPERVWGRTPANINWTCARCHTGERPSFAAGIATWNSTESSDAYRGHCYRPATRPEHPTSMLTCVTCHDPHTATGQKWSRSAAADDASCVRCHQQFEPPSAVTAHTHHPADSPGSRCMNCHMPKINEGMQDVVRTHTIFSPTEPRMLESNHPNACNLCHLDRPIDWTLQHLRSWYGTDRVTLSEAELSRNYPDRDGPVGIGWLKSPHESTRLVAAEALGKADARWALPHLIEVLDDPYLLNRQFTQKNLEAMLDVDLSELGYRFYMTPRERREPIERIRTALLRDDAATPQRHP